MFKNTVDKSTLLAEGIDKLPKSIEEQAKSAENYKENAQQVSEAVKQTEKQIEEDQKKAAILAKKIKDGGNSELEEVEKLNKNYEIYINWIKKGEGERKLNGLEIDGFEVKTDVEITYTAAKRNLWEFFLDEIGYTRNYAMSKEDEYRFIFIQKGFFRRRCVIGKDGKLYFKGDEEFESQLKNDPRRNLTRGGEKWIHIKVDTPNTDLSTMGKNSPLLKVLEGDKSKDK